MTKPNNTVIIYPDNAADLPRAIEKMTGEGVVRYERYPMLDVVYDNFTRMFSQSLRGLFGDEVNVTLMNSAVMRFGDYVDTIKLPAMFCVFNAREWQAEGLINVNGELIDATTELLLGGSGFEGGKSMSRSYSHIDETLTKRLVNTALESLSQGFRRADEEIGFLSMRVTRLETNPSAVNVTRENNVVAMANFLVDIGESGRGGEFELILPYPMMESVRKLLVRAYKGEQGGRDNLWMEHLLNSIPDTRVVLQAVVDRRVMTVADVNAFKVGDVLPLDIDVSDPIGLWSENRQGTGLGKKMFSGMLGSAKGRKAVKLDLAEGEPG